ncbi:hypothetical protein [Endothiovibrio diazotrophicus]
MRTLPHLLWIAGLLLLVGCTHPDPRPNAVPLPHLDGPVTLRVIHAVNPRLPVMSAEQRRILLDQAARTSRAHFGLDVRFEEQGEIPIGELFARLPEDQLAARRELIYDFKHGGGDRQRLVKSMLETFRRQQTPLAQRIAYARPHLAVPLREESAQGLAEALIDTLLARLQEWREIRLADGKPLLDDTPYNEWALWDALGYGELPWEVVITNQPMASAEYVDQDIHSALRGGVGVGSTGYSRASRNQTVSYWSTFPFTSELPTVVKLRGGEHYTPEEAARLSGAYLAHEIGHQLLHLGHPFGRPACVMRPVELLRFRRWYEALDPAACKVGSGPSMSPGAVKIQY